MNVRIKELAEQAETKEIGYYFFDREKFAELIVQECKENIAKVWYEQGMDILGAELGKFLTRFEERFGVK